MFAEKVEIALIKTNMTKTELANKLDTSVQNIHKRIKQDNMTEKQMQEIATALSGELVLKLKIGDIEL